MASSLLGKVATSSAWISSIFKSQTHRILCSRTIMDDNFLRLTNYKERVSNQQERFGKVAEEFKTQFIERLGDPSSMLLQADYEAFVDLADVDDTQHFPAVFKKFMIEQKKLEEIGLEDAIFHIDPLMIRKCHLVNSPDSAVAVLKQATKANDRAVHYSSLLVTMDLLFDNEMYQQALEIAEANIEKCVGYNAILRLSILSAYRLGSMQGLKFCAKTLDMMRKGKHPLQLSLTKSLELLIVFYCVDQGQINAALAMLNQMSADNEILTGNLKMYALLKAGRPTSACRILQSIIRKLEAKMESGEYDSAKDFAVFNDVLTMLYDTAADEDKKFLGFVHALQRKHEDDPDNTIRMRMRKPMEKYLLYPFLPMGTKKADSATVEAESASPHITTDDSEYEVEMSGGYYVDDKSAGEKSAEGADESSSSSDGSDSSDSSDSSSSSDEEDNKDSKLSETTEEKAEPKEGAAV